MFVAFSRFVEEEDGSKTFVQVAYTGDAVKVSVAREDGVDGNEYSNRVAAAVRELMDPALLIPANLGPRVEPLQ